jgi:hypothetical protein
MGTMIWDVVQNAVLVCVQWGDDVSDDIWDELGDTIMENRGDDELLPVIVVTDGRGPSRAQQRRFEARFNQPIRITFMTRASSAMQTAHAIQSPRVHVAITSPGDYVSAVVHLHLSDSLVSPIAVTVTRLLRELSQSATSPLRQARPDDVSRRSLSRRSIQLARGASRF